MKRKLLLFILMLISAVLLLGGCMRAYDTVARTRAEKYISEKYGFNAEVKKVVLSENSWLEFNFEAPAIANVRMAYGGREFDVLVPVRNDNESGYADNYEQDVICAEIEKYIRDSLDCEKLDIRIDYGMNYGRNMLPKDIRSAADLVKSDDTKTISVYTYGLDPASVNGLDPRKYGDNTRYGIADLLDPELPEIEYGTMTELPVSGGWKIGGLYYTDHNAELHCIPYERTVIDNVCLVMPAECGVKFEKADGRGEPGDDPVTGWYSISGTGEGHGRLYVSVDDKNAEYCIEYPGTETAFYERIPHLESGGAEYDLFSDRYCPGNDKPVVFRIVKRDFYAEAQK